MGATATAGTEGNEPGTGETPPETDPTTTTTTTPPDPLAAAIADAEKWKALSRKHEAESKTGKAAAARLAELEAAQLSELERANAAAADAIAKATAADERANRATISTAVTAAASAAGAINPAAVLKLLPADAVTLDGDNVVGVEAAIKALVTSDPYLFGVKPKPPAGSGDGGARGGTPLAITREQLKTMSPQQVAALNPADIARAMSAP